MTKTQRGVERDIDGRRRQLAQLMRAAWQQGVHVAWTVDGEVVVGGPDTPAARSAMDALLPYAELLRQEGLCCLAYNGIPPMPSLEAAQDYVRHAIARDHAAGRPLFPKALGEKTLNGFLKVLGIGPEHVSKKTLDS